MKTVIESANRRLRRELGLPELSTSRPRPRVGDWMKLNTGDRVHRVDDPRHEGRVEAIEHGALVRVLWDGTPPAIEVLELREVTKTRGD